MGHPHGPLDLDMNYGDAARTPRLHQGYRVFLEIVVPIKPMELPYFGTFRSLIPAPGLMHIQQGYYFLPDEHGSQDRGATRHRTMSRGAIVGLRGLMAERYGWKHCMTEWGE